MAILERIKRFEVSTKIMNSTKGNKNRNKLEIDDFSNWTSGDLLQNIVRGPFAEWFKSIDAEVPTREQIENKIITNVNGRYGDHIETQESYKGGDDVHEQIFVPGWDTEKDTLGGG